MSRLLLEVMHDLSERWHEWALQEEMKKELIQTVYNDLSVILDTIDSKLNPEDRTYTD